MWNGVNCEPFPSVSAGLMPPLPHCFLLINSCMSQIDTVCIKVPGLHEYTHMDGHKAHCLMRCWLQWKTKISDFSLVRYCSINHYPCVLYDHECTGRSSKLGGNVWSKSWNLSCVSRNISGMIVVFFPQVNELQFSHWVEDVLAVVENLTDGPIVLVKPHK